MKKLKNNKGITGVDITASIVVLMVAVGIISTLYTKYINNSKQIKRNTEANNILMDFIEYIEKTDYDVIDTMFNEYGVDTNKDSIVDKFEVIAEADDDLVDVFGIEVKEAVSEIPSGYKVILNKQEKIEGIAMKVNIDVSYSIASKEKNISLSLIKTRSMTEANSPDMQVEEIKNATKGDGKARYTLKYSKTRGGYIQAKSTDDDWYSISGKRYPLVVYAEQKDFDVNGVINLEKCEEIYLWVPRFGKIDQNNYGFCYNTTNNRIIYGDTEKKISDTAGEIPIFGYTVDNSKEMTNIPIEFEVLTGKWVKVNPDLNPIDNLGTEITDENNILNILKTKQFTWN